LAGNAPFIEALETTKVCEAGQPDLRRVQFPKRRWPTYYKVVRTLRHIEMQILTLVISMSGRNSSSTKRRRKNWSCQKQQMRKNAC
jgi:hypothetical protein